MLKIRLRREGARNHPFFRVVVSDSRRTPTGPNLEVIGHYNPKADPPQVEIDIDKYDHWVGRGADASDSVKSLVAARRKRQGLLK